MDTEYKTIKVIPISREVGAEIQGADIATGINDEERPPEEATKPKLMKLSAYKKELESAQTVASVKDVARRYSKMVDCEVWNKMEIEEAGEAYHAKLKEFEGV